MVVFDLVFGSGNFSAERERAENLNPRIEDFLSFRKRGEEKLSRTKVNRRFSVAAQAKKILQKFATKNLEMCRFSWQLNAHLHRSTSNSGRNQKICNKIQKPSPILAPCSTFPTSLVASSPSSLSSPSSSFFSPILRWQMSLRRIDLKAEGEKKGTFQEGSEDATRRRSSSSEEPLRVSFVAFGTSRGSHFPLVVRPPVE